MILLRAIGATIMILCTGACVICLPVYLWENAPSLRVFMERIGIGLLIFILSSPIWGIILMGVYEHIEEAESKKRAARVKAKCFHGRS